MKRTDIAWRRLNNQRLIGLPFSSVREAVSHMTAVQSQDYYGAKWGLAQRLNKVKNADIDRLFDEGTFLRTHVMRPTWHFVLPEDIRWMLALTAPRVSAVMSHYNRKLDLDRRLFDRCNGLMAKALHGGQYKTRNELAEVLKDAGIKAKGQRLAHIVMQAELDAVICSGPRRSKQFTYALLDEKATKAKNFNREEAIADLAQRYFSSHGPATPADFAWWSGLTVADARVGLEANRRQLISIEVDRQVYWFKDSPAPSKPGGPLVHLLPNYDEYLIAYKGYGAIFNPLKLSPEITNALIYHIVVMDSQVIGGWKSPIGKSKVNITTKLLVKLNKTQQNALRAAAKLYGQFLGLPVVLDGEALDSK